MSNKIIITDSDAFEDVIRNFEKTLPEIKKIFENELRITQSIDGTPIWTGEAQKAFSEKYKELALNFPVIEESVDIYTKFLKKVINDYKTLNTNISNKADEIANAKLDVKS